MSIKQIHYNIDNIDKENADFNLIYRRKIQWEKLSSKTQKSSRTLFENGKTIYIIKKMERRYI